MDGDGRNARGREGPAGLGGSGGLGGLVSAEDALRLERSRALTRHAAVLAISLWTLALLQWHHALGLDAGSGPLVWGTGALLVVVVAGARRRRLADALRGGTLVDADGHVVGRADEVPLPPAYRAVTGFFGSLLVIHVAIALVNLALGVPLHERSLILIAIATTVVVRSLTKRRRTPSRADP